VKGRLLWHSNLLHLLPSSLLFPPKPSLWVILVEDRQCFGDDAIATVAFTLCRESYKNLENLLDALLLLFVVFQLISFPSPWEFCPRLRALHWASSTFSRPIKNFGPQGFFINTRHRHGHAMSKRSSKLEVKAISLFALLNVYSCSFQWTPFFVQFLNFHLTMLTILHRYSSLVSKFFNSVVTDADAWCIITFKRRF